MFPRARQTTRDVFCALMQPPAGACITGLSPVFLPALAHSGSSMLCCWICWLRRLPGLHEQLRVGRLTGSHRVVTAIRVAGANWQTVFSNLACILTLQVGYAAFASAEVAGSNPVARLLRAVVSNGQRLFFVDRHATYVEGQQLSRS